MGVVFIRSGVFMLKTTQQRLGIVLAIGLLVLLVILLQWLVLPESAGGEKRSAFVVHPENLIGMNIWRQARVSNAWSCDHAAVPRACGYPMTHVLR